MVRVELVRNMENYAISQRIRAACKGKEACKVYEIPCNRERRSTGCLSSKGAQDKPETNEVDSLIG